MLDFDTAQQKLASAASAPQDSVTVALADANGRVLAQDVLARLDAPPADNSAMDGYALRAADYAEGRGLPVQQRIYAGAAPEPLAPGQAARLFTGSLLPAGADTIAIQEDCNESDGEVFIACAPQPGQWVRRRGEDVARGARLLAAGSLIGPAQIAALASQGLDALPMFPRLRVGILTTGDELVAPGQPRADQQIYNSNGPMLAALAQNMGAQVPRVLHARDELGALRAAFEQLIDECDLVISVGGVSVGERDLVKPALHELGGELDLWKVRMKPGKPLTLSHVRGTPVIGLPGNPVSAYVVFALMVSPLIRRMQGRAEVFPAIDAGTVSTPKPLRDEREEFMRAQSRVNERGERQFVLYPQQGSHVISSLPWAHGLVRLPAGTTVNDGDLVRYYDLRHWLS